jgi:hypothetical protein
MFLVTTSAEVSGNQKLSKISIIIIIIIVVFVVDFVVDILLL